MLGMLIVNRLILQACSLALGASTSGKDAAHRRSAILVADLEVCTRTPP